jgi:8-oxo-dGTP pyrophosphatase MutT (NUDIX family)
MSGIGSSLNRTIQQHPPIKHFFLKYHVHRQYPLLIQPLQRIPMLRNSIIQYRHYHRTILCRNQNDDTDSSTKKQRPLHRRVWKAKALTGDASAEVKSESSKDGDDGELYWTDRVIDQSWQEQQGSMATTPTLSKADTIQEFIQRISTQSDVLGGKMPERQLGVLHQDPVTDMQLLIDNYTVKAVASALRDREDALQRAATLASENRIEELCAFLQIFHPKYVLERREQQKQVKRHIQVFNPNDTNSNIHTGSKNNSVAVTSATSTTNDPITALHLDASRQILRKALMRMPRTITTAHSKRAGVCLALCLVNGVPSILLEKRARHLRNHPDEVCFPGGMVCDIQDQTIVSTSIREMKEEIGGLEDNETTAPIEVIGILRLNWGEVHHLTGVAVTPVVCYLGELPDLSPNPEEVSEVFTIPLVDLLNKSFWIHKDALAPIFVGGPYVIWGLTGYILERFAIELGRLSTSTYR